MTKVIRYTSEYLCMISDYGSPDKHRHLAAHLICATEGSLRCNIGSDIINCNGIILRSGAEHEIQADSKMIVFLFADPSPITDILYGSFLISKDYSVISDDIVSEIQIFCRNQCDDLDDRILKLLGIYSNANISADERVLSAIAEIDAAPSVDSDMMDRLCRKTFLSQSRLSHLFKQETGSTLAGYLSFMKLRKAFEYAENGLNLTDSAMLAGFDSSSHLAATCKRMFGISLSAFLRSQKI